MTINESWSIFNLNLVNLVNHTHTLCTHTHTLQLGSSLKKKIKHSSLNH